MLMITVTMMSMTISTFLFIQHCFQSIFFSHYNHACFFPTKMFVNQKTFFSPFFIFIWMFFFNKNQPTFKIICLQPGWLNQLLTKSLIMSFHLRPHTIKIRHKRSLLVTEEIKLKRPRPPPANPSNPLQPNL